jgi:hypothetical protein
MFVCPTFQSFQHLFCQNTTILHSRLFIFHCCTPSQWKPIARRQRHANSLSTDLPAKTLRHALCDNNLLLYDAQHQCPLPIKEMQRLVGFRWIFSHWLGSKQPWYHSSSANLHTLWLPWLVHNIMKLLSDIFLYNCCTVLLLQVFILGAVPLCLGATWHLYWQGQEKNTSSHSSVINASIYWPSVNNKIQEHYKHKRSL